MDVATVLTFDDQAQAAAAYYTSIFPRSRLIQTTYAPAGLPATEGSVMSVSFELAGRPFLAMNTGPGFAIGQSASLAALCDAQSEVDVYWQRLLADGGEALAYGWLKDRFGVSWQVAPKVLYQLMADHDPGRRARAIAAMMGMGKLDAQALLLAADSQELPPSE